MSQRKLDTFFKLKSDTQQPTPDIDKGDRDINVSEAISEGPSSVASTVFFLILFFIVER